MGELFDETGFEIGDKVYVDLDSHRYFGVVIKTDSRLDRIKVDYTSRNSELAVDWFDKGFWKKVEQ
jgi:hypothetical protein